MAMQFSEEDRRMLVGLNDLQINAVAFIVRRGATEMNQRTETVLTERLQGNQQVLNEQADKNRSQINDIGSTLRNEFNGGLASGMENFGAKLVVMEEMVKHIQTTNEKQETYINEFEAKVNERNAKQEKYITEFEDKVSTKYRG